MDTPGVQATAIPAGTAEPLPEPSAPRSQGLGPRGIAGATLIVMLFFVLSRVTGLAREMIIGAQFGTGADLDAYLAAFRLPDLLFQLVAGGALGSAFIPTFATYWVRDDRAGAWLLFSRVLNLVTLILVLMAGLGAVFSPLLVEHVIAPGFSPEQQALTASLMRWMLLSTVIFGASGLVMAALNALQHFLLPAVAPVVYNVSIILGAWFLAPVIGVYGLVAGVIVGALGHLLVQIPGLVRQRAQYTFDWTVRDPGVYEVARLMAPRVLGLFFVQLHFLVNTILASGLSEGSLSSLNYAWLLMLLPLGVFAQAIATASFPTLSAQIAAGQSAAMRATFGQILRIVFFLTIPAATASVPAARAGDSTALPARPVHRAEHADGGLCAPVLCAGAGGPFCGGDHGARLLCPAQHVDAGGGGRGGHGAEHRAEPAVGGRAGLRRAGAGQHHGHDAGDGRAAVAAAPAAWAGWTGGVWRVRWHAACWRPRSWAACCGCGWSACRRRSPRCGWPRWAGLALAAAVYVGASALLRSDELREARRMLPGRGLTRRRLPASSRKI